MTRFSILLAACTGVVYGVALNTLDCTPCTQACEQGSGVSCEVAVSEDQGSQKCCSASETALSKKIYSFTTFSQENEETEEEANTSEQPLDQEVTTPVPTLADSTPTPTVLVKDSTSTTSSPSAGTSAPSTAILTSDGTELPTEVPSSAWSFRCAVSLLFATMVFA